MTDRDYGDGLVIPISVTIPAWWLDAYGNDASPPPTPPFRGWPQATASFAKHATTHSITDAPSYLHTPTDTELPEPYELPVQPTLVGGQYNPRAVLAEQQLIGKLGKALADRYFGPGKQAPAPALRGDPYHPDEVDSRIRPRYAPNPAHNPSHPMPNKTLEPTDAEQVFTKSVQGSKQGTWFGLNGEGQIYQFRGDNIGGAHFTAIVPPDTLPPATREQLGIK